METPRVIQLDMGMLKKPKYAVFWPKPVYFARDGRQYYIHPKKRYASEKAALKAIAKAEGKEV